jgi:hypothetical protein
MMHGMTKHECRMTKEFQSTNAGEAASRQFVI